MKDGDSARGGSGGLAETRESMTRLRTSPSSLSELGGGQDRGEGGHRHRLASTRQPGQPLGHYFDKNAPRKPGDVDVDLFSPQLVDEMVRSGAPTANEKVLVGGERTIFKNVGGAGETGFHNRFPAVRKFIKDWSRKLGREVDVKLRLDVKLPPKPKTGPIEFFRKEGAKPQAPPKAPPQTPKGNK